MIEAEIRALIQKELPRAIAEEPAIRDFVLRTVSEYYTPRTEFDQKFDRVMAELQRDREEQARKWDESNRKFYAFQAEQARKWDENNQKFKEKKKFNFEPPLASIEKKMFIDYCTFTNSCD